ncbi:2-dehydro-3-deoxygalactonokinase [Antarctobacter jejuensis]|uniref:2-dehydro-3-deoxygalactonokinase n=1 Tax=Antarctobacter jejuensis TaxID=1439938 RepID=UPI003FD0AA85
MTDRTGQPAFVGVDWGTSSFRLWVLSAGGRVLAERKGGEGMSTLTPDQFGPVLQSHLEGLRVPHDVPVLVCGMAGARTGWREAGYMDLPLRLSDLATATTCVPGFTWDVRILPGAAQRQAMSPDVMRGEETMLLGALRLGGQGWFCMPGTHSKWAQVQDGVLTRFDTFMTGETFALFSGRSTLSGFVYPNRFDAAVFDCAVEAAFQRPQDSLRSLFQLRAGPLLQLVDPGEVASRLSGLLIGMEIAGCQEAVSGEVCLIASGLLAERYSRALAVAGMGIRHLDADRAVRAGLSAAAEDLWPQTQHKETAR